MPPTSRTFRAPRGTRDAYPEDALKRRYITQAWRDASIRHGFDEIEGPTFEHLELYTQKSGDEIVSQLFSFRREGGDDDYALRPEFTPTLARMYAARANSLPRPTKWFTAGPYFRAEKPQRGRLREFLQWNCDIMGDEAGWNPKQSDAEIVAVVVGSLRDLGLTFDTTRIKVNSREAIRLSASRLGVDDVSDSLFSLLDARPKLGSREFRARAGQMNLPSPFIDEFDPDKRTIVPMNATVEDYQTIFEIPRDEAEEAWANNHDEGSLSAELRAHGLGQDSEYDNMVVRGLDYYTGMVFEVIAEGERAVCGGGRFDDLIELFGGPPTPAVGFGMGDVVLSLLLEDKGLMPQGKELLDAVSRPQASVRPDAFVITADEQFDPVVKRTVATLRAGRESEPWLQRDDRTPWDADRYAAAPLHARRSYKATRHIGKLLKDATSQHARHAVIIESDEVCNVKNLDTGEQREKIALADLSAHLA